MKYEKYLLSEGIDPKKYSVRFRQSGTYAAGDGFDTLEGAIKWAMERKKTNSDIVHNKKVVGWVRYSNGKMTSSLD